MLNRALKQTQIGPVSVVALLHQSFWVCVLDLKFEDACPKSAGSLRLRGQLHGAHVHLCLRVAPIALLWLCSSRSTYTLHAYHSDF